MTTLKVFYMLMGKLLYILIGFCLGFILFRYTNINNKITDYSNTNLFYEVHPIGSSGTFDKRLEKAAKLAQNKDMADWLIVLLLDNNGIDYSLDQVYQDPNVKQKTKKELITFEKGIIAELMNNIPDDSPKSVLFAITTKLTDNDTGAISKTWGIFPFKTFADGQTKPIKDVARDTLKRCLKADYDYDINKWREAIINNN